MKKELLMIILLLLAVIYIFVDINNTLNKASEEEIKEIYDSTWLKPHVFIPMVWIGLPMIIFGGWCIKSWWAYRKPFKDR